MQYTNEQIKKLEEKKKALADKIAKAKKSLARKNAEKERKRRTHQMCVFGGDVEKIFEEELGQKIWLPENEAEIEFLKDSIRKTVRQYKGKQFPKLEEKTAPEPPQTEPEEDFISSLLDDDDEEEEEISTLLGKLQPDSF